MDKRSELVLATVNPALADKVRAAANDLANAGTYLLVVSGLRTAAEQNALYAQGRTRPGHIVTNAKAGFSMHNYGLAVDIVPYLSGSSGQLNWRANTAQFRAMVTALEAQDLVWGGAWKTFPDEDHFQMPGVPASPNAVMLADYKDGDADSLTLVWTKVAAGGYAV